MQQQPVSPRIYLLMISTRCSILLILSIVASSASVQMLRAESSSVASPNDFNRDIRPILSNNCYYCHGPDDKQRKGGKQGLRLDTAEGQRENLGGYPALIPGKPEASELIKRIVTTDEDDHMPPAESGKKYRRRNWNY